MAESGGDNPRSDLSRCTGCGRCVAACPKKKIHLAAAGTRRQCAFVAEVRCARCGLCVQECLFSALAIPE